eukprot:gene5766-6202_t
MIVDLLESGKTSFVSSDELEPIEETFDTWACEQYHAHSLH